MKLFSPAEYLGRVRSSVIRVNSRLNGLPTPQFTLTLGSGLGSLLKAGDTKCVIEYKDVDFMQPQAAGHAGKLVYCVIGGVPVLVQVGRTHYNDVAHIPHGIQEVVFPTHVMASLGIPNCITTNAVGGLNPGFSVGHMMIIMDHVSQLPSPFTGPHISFGNNPFFPSMAEPYSKKLTSLFTDASQVYAPGHTRHGIYLAVTGRQYETAAECRYYRSMGVDAVGMSTVPEIMVAGSRGMNTLGVSLVTNVIDAESGQNDTNHAEVMSVADDPAVQRRMRDTFIDFFERYAATQKKAASA